MKLRQIEIFHAVYVTGSVSAAARLLNISQPSVTKILRYAESSLGLSLFERTKGRLVPTEDAHELFVEVEEVQKRVEQLRRASRNLRFGQGRTLRVSVLPSLGLGAIPEAV
ncbi:MAG TPA: LysR family transcriptional regulator, partial [Sphingopyxis sp.]|nr:LysR family transcriptional regulator [Sphingopyxis sp.]